MNSYVNLIESFLAVAEDGSISKAARKLNITQPSLSRQMQALEEQLGVELFRREASGAKLTESGKQLQDRMTPLLKDIAGVIADLQKDKTNLTGTVSLGLLTEVGQSRIFSHVLAFRKEHPEVVLEVQYRNEYEIIEKVRRGDLHFGVVTEKVVSEEIRCFELLRENSMVVSRAACKIKLDDWESFREAPFVVYGRNDPLCMALLRTHFPHVPLNRLFTPVIVNSHRSMIEALIDFDSFAVMPHHVVDDLISRKILKQAFPKKLEGSLYLISSESSQLFHRHKVLQKFLLSHMQES